jgi:hypothetical protein
VGRTRKASNWRSFCRGYRFDVCPSTDDKPFFFNQSRLSQLGTSSAYAYSSDPFQVLVITLGVLVGVALVAYLLPLRFVHRPAPPTAGSLSYFAAIGLGYILLEVVLIQRFVLFLGFPTYALSVVLFALLIFSGVGSALSSRFVRSRRGLVVTLAVAIVLTALGAAWLEPLLRSLSRSPSRRGLRSQWRSLRPWGSSWARRCRAGYAASEACIPTASPTPGVLTGLARYLPPCSAWPWRSPSGSPSRHWSPGHAMSQQ